MNIEVKYPVGYKFYEPRVYERWDTETIQHPDSTGVIQEYSRSVKKLQAVVKQKIVDHIEVTIADCVEIRYWCLNFGTDSMATIVPECDMDITDFDTAVAMANELLKKQTPYYGSSLD